MNVNRICVYMYVYIPVLLPLSYQLRIQWPTSWNHCSGRICSMKIVKYYRERLFSLFVCFIYLFFWDLVAKHLPTHHWLSYFLSSLPPSFSCCLLFPSFPSFLSLAILPFPISFLFAYFAFGDHLLVLWAWLLGMMWFNGA